MFNKTFIVVCISMFLLLTACQTGKEDAKKFSDDYRVLSEKMRVKQDQVKTRDEYVAFKESRKKEFENLMKKFEKSPSIDEIEILRSKVLYEIEKLDDAEKKIDRVLAKESDFIPDAKMVKVLILLERKKYQEAYNIFKDIENQVKDPYDLYNTYYYLGSVLEDAKIKEELCNKFLNSKQLPKYFIDYKSDLYLTLASIAKQEGNYEKAKNALKKGIAETKDPGTKKYLENTMGQIDYYGKPAFSISAGTWLNSSPLKINDLKGKVVIISFWAPWCPGCRELTPTLVELYNNHKDKGLMIIGYTRFYGRYEDDRKDFGKVTKEEELDHIKKYLERKKVSYPIAITEDKNDYTTYKIAALPTLVLIDKNGNIDFSKIGGGDVKFLKEKIAKLLVQ